MKQRTTQQNKSLHLYFEFLATELNNAGYDVLKTLRHDISIDWNATLIKELIWRKVQLASYKKKSTSDLTSGELQVMWETINRHIGEKFGIHVPFPSLEDLVEQDRRMKPEYPVHEGEVTF